MVTITGNSIAINNTGSVTVTATAAATLNYNEATTTLDITVGKATLTATADNQTKVYGTANPVLTTTYTGFVYGEDESVIDTPATITTTADDVSDVDIYDIITSSAEDNNYNFVYVKGSLSITQAIQEIGGLSDIIKTYGDAEYTLEGIAEGAVTYSVPNNDVISIIDNNVTINNVGSVTVTAVAAETQNYFEASTTFDVTVNKTIITVTADDKTKVYTFENPPYTISYDGFVYNEDSTVFDVLPTCSSIVDVNSPVDTYEILVSGATASNYDFVYVNGTFSVTKATQYIIDFAEMTKTYGDQAFELNGSAEGEVTYSTEDSDIVTIEGNTVTIVGAGSATITATAAETPDYEEAKLPVVITIDKAELIASAVDNTRKYSEINPEFMVEISGFVYEDNKSLIDTAPTATTDATTESPIGEYVITPANGVDNNYYFVYENATLTITPAHLDFIVTDTSPTYTSTALFATVETDPAGVSITTTYEKNGVVVENPITLGEYDVISISADSNYEGNNTTIMTIVDRTAPVITLTEDAEVDFVYGSDYIEYGATVSDDWDTDINTTIDASEVDMWVAGTYTVKYNVTDSSGNVATEVTRTVNIVFYGDTDGDNIDDEYEDINMDNDLRNDDSDEDGIPNYLDDDDDGDGISTIDEGALDWDCDDIPDYLDTIDNSLLFEKWGDVILISNYNNEYFSYQWYKNDVIIDGATEQFYHEEGGLNGRYYVIVTLIDQTQFTSCEVTIINKNAPEVSMNIFPNPVANSETLNINLLQGDEIYDENADVYVYSMSGKLIKTQVVEEGVSQLNISNLPTAIYCVKVVTNGGQVIIKQVSVQQ